jgi:hypothetical protein
MSCLGLVTGALDLQPIRVTWDGDILARLRAPAMNRSFSTVIVAAPGCVCTRMCAFGWRPRYAAFLVLRGPLADRRHAVRGIVGIASM